MSDRPYPYVSVLDVKVTLHASDGHSRKPPKDFLQSHPPDSVTDVTYSMAADVGTRKKWLTKIGTLLIRDGPLFVPSMLSLPNSLQSY